MENRRKNIFGKECYRLYLNQYQFYEDESVLLASFVQDDTDENTFIYVSEELDVEYDTLSADSVEDAKHQIEEMLVDHWNDEIDCLEKVIKLF